MSHPYGRTSGPSSWKDHVVTVLMLVFGACAIAFTLRIADQNRVNQARVLLDGEAPLDEVVSIVQADWVELNAKDPGSAVDAGAHAGKKPHTIVVWASGHCPSSRQMVACLKRIACLKLDTAVRHIEVDRAGATAIDWESAAAAQVPAPRAFPYLAVYDGAQLVAQGKPAKDIVRGWYEATFTHPRLTR